MSIDPTKITVIHCDPKTGHIVDPEPYMGFYKPATQLRPAFESIEAAREYCWRTVEEFPHLECWICGPGSDPYERYVNEAWLAAEDARRAAFYAKQRRTERITKIALLMITCSIIGGVI
jgi:hypothetical protein